MGIGINGQRARGVEISGWDGILLHLVVFHICGLADLDSPTLFVGEEMFELMMALQPVSEHVKAYIHTDSCDVIGPHGYTYTVYPSSAVMILQHEPCPY